MSRRANPEYRWTMSPTDRLDLSGTPWVADVSAQVAEVVADPQLKLLVGPRIEELLHRARSAPRIEGDRFVKISRASIDPREYEWAPEGWYIDARTGDDVVQEHDGSWWHVTPPPQGAFTVGELVRLDHELEEALTRLADAAEAGALTPAQRKLAGTQLGDAAEDVGMRVMLLTLKLTPEEQGRIKRSALEVLAGRDENPDRRRSTLKRSLKRF